MNRLALPLLILLTLALLGALMVQERQAQHFDSQVSSLTNQLIKREQQTRRLTSQVDSLLKNEEILKADSKSLRERLHTIAAATPENHPNSAPVPTPAEPKAGSSGMVKEMISDPQIQNAVDQHQQISLGKTYAAFIKQAGLAAQEAKQLIDILATRREAVTEGTGTASVRPPNDRKAEIKALLGDDRAAQFEEFEKTLPAPVSVTNQQISSTTVEEKGGQGFISINGAVRNPGRVPATQDLTLMGVINAAGGLNDFADPKVVRLVHGGEAKEIDVRKIRKDSTLDPKVFAGDQIEVPQSNW